MKYGVSILLEAEIDIENAYIWYELRLLDLGNEFFVTVDESIHLITKNPFISAEIYKGIRRFVIKRFPYGIYYKINHDINEIQILGVIHFKRSTRLIKNRTK